MIWWLWSAYDPVKVQIINLNWWWREQDPDVYWLGEIAWTARGDTMNFGLR